MANFLQVLFWLAVAVIVYTFLGYPILVGLLARWRPNPVQQAAITPQVSVLVPAYDEAGVIAAKIENTLALDYPPDRLECVVVADGSTDGTEEIAAGYAAQAVRVLYQPLRQGKAAAINRAVPLLHSDVVVLTDANAMLNPGALQAIVPNFADPAVGGVAGEKRVLGGGEGLYWRYESYLKRCDSALTSVMGAAGELLAVRRDLYQPPEPDSIIEDFVLSLRLVENGWRVAYAPDAVALEAASPHLAGDWQRRTRIAAGGFQAMARLPSLLDPRRGLVAWQYFSHRVLRWAATPFLLPLVYLLNLLLLSQPLYQVLAAGQTLFYGTAALGYLQAHRGARSGLPYVAFYFCLTNAAALAGFWRYITRTQPVTWAKVR
jgi:biofilm PGA synthesis N-glycosyltransferase PgaC